MKRILSLFASLLAAGTVLSAQEYESVADVLIDYGKLEDFTCEVAEGDEVPVYFLFHDYVPEFLNEDTLPRTHKLVHFFVSGTLYEDDADSFAMDFGGTIDQQGYFLLHDSELAYEFIRNEADYVYEYVLYDLSTTDDSVHIWVLCGDYSMDMFPTGEDVVSILFEYMDYDQFYITMWDDREAVDALVAERFDLFDTHFGDNFIQYTMVYDDSDVCGRFLERLNDALDSDYEQYGQTDDGAMYFCKSDENFLYQLVYIYWDDEMLHIYVADGELPMDQFVVG
ncbi:MAG: hypothetical protein LIQ26_04785 [Bacteroidota bacterium]|nr:hypothetical protein [Bacteroidota bacterium]